MMKESRTSERDAPEMSTANRQTTAAAGPPRGVHDPEFDAPRAPRRGGANWTTPPHHYQRLVANPFLAFFGLVAWSGLMSQGLQTKRLDLSLLATGSVVLVAFLFQYHCLDCGATDRLGRWREHNCAAVQARRRAGAPRRFRGPTPDNQTRLWVVFLVLAAVGYSIALL